MLDQGADPCLGLHVYEELQADCTLLILFELPSREGGVACADPGVDECLTRRRVYVAICSDERHALGLHLYLNYIAGYYNAPFKQSKPLS